jgi:hypothetical protein
MQEHQDPNLVAIDPELGLTHTVSPTMTKETDDRS